MKTKKWTPPEIVWHYTIRKHAESIISEGKIRIEGDTGETNNYPSSLNGAFTPDTLPCVWFSCKQDWEPGANKLFEDASGNIVTATVEQMIEWAGIARFGVPYTAPYLLTFDQWVGRCENKRFAEKIRSVSLEFGSKPRDCRVSLEAVTSDKWVAIEHFENGEWSSIDGSYQLDIAV